MRSSGQQRMKKLLCLYRLSSLVSHTVVHVVYGERHPTCAAAVCFSGQVRSFMHPRVYMTTKKLLIDAAQGGYDGQPTCQVDVYMYVSLDDQGRDLDKKEEGFELLRALNFEPKSWEKEELEKILPVFNPVEVAYHSEQAGFLTKQCPSAMVVIDGELVERPKVCFPNAYWQLYKLSACHAMITRREKLQGWLYDLVVRTRFDLGWIDKIPPLATFPRDRVYVGNTMTPMNDMFFIIPRAFSSVVMDSVKHCFSCDTFEPLYMHKAQVEGVLWKAIISSGIKFAVYNFPFVLVRYGTGCQASATFLYQAEGRLIEGFGGTPRTDIYNAMTSVLNRWIRDRCGVMFPGLKDLPPDHPNYDHHSPLRLPAHITRDEIALKNSEPTNESFGTHAEEMKSMGSREESVGVCTSGTCIFDSNDYEDITWREMMSMVSSINTSAVRSPGGHPDDEYLRVSVSTLYPFIVGEFQEMKQTFVVTITAEQVRTLTLAVKCKLLHWLQPSDDNVFHTADTSMYSAYNIDAEECAHAVSVHDAWLSILEKGCENSPDGDGTGIEYLTG